MQILAFSISTSDTGGLVAYGIVALIAAILLMLLGLIAFPAFLAAGLARRHAEKIRNNWAGTVITQFDPPRGLTPAEMGLLYDMRSTQNELMATVFHLEQRKIVRIADDHTVDILNEEAYKSLQEYEKIAVRATKGETGGLDTQRTVPLTLTNTETGQTYTFNLPVPPKSTLQSFAEEVRKSLVAKGIPVRKFGPAFFKRVMIVTLVLIFLPMLMIALPGTSNGVEYGAWTLQAFFGSLITSIMFGFLLFPVYVGAALIFMLLWVKIAGRYWMNTKQARAIWPELEGYKLFLKQVDIDNIQFESTDTAFDPVTQSLPYAMVFGLDTKWQARLAGRAHPGKP